MMRRPLLALLACASLGALSAAAAQAPPRASATGQPDRPPTTSFNGEMRGQGERSQP